MVTDQIADLLTRIRNAQTAGHPAVSIPASKNKERILKVLADEGFIASFEVLKDAKNMAFIKVYLRYQENNVPVIKEINRISRPGKRVYVAQDDIPSFKGGLGVVIVSTSQGMLSGKEAVKQGLGGELICSVF